MNLLRLLSQVLDHLLTTALRQGLDLEPYEGGGCIGLDHVVGVSIWSYCICDWVTQVFELCMDPLCMDHWLRLA